MFVLETNQSGQKPGRAGRGQSDQAAWQAEVINKEGRRGAYINISGESPSIKPNEALCYYNVGAQGKRELSGTGTLGSTGLHSLF